MTYVILNLHKYPHIRAELSTSKRGVIFSLLNNLSFVTAATATATAAVATAAAAATNYVLAGF